LSEKITLLEAFMYCKGTIKETFRIQKIYDDKSIKVSSVTISSERSNP
jgi:hypothetical protein